MANQFGWTVERTNDFSVLAEEFRQRVFSTVWCNVATVDARDRPRSRILHPWWECASNPTGWIVTRRHSLKEEHLERNPFVSCAYIGDIARPVYIDCRAGWIEDLAEKERIWAAFKNAAPPMGYDPATIFPAVDDPDLGLLCLDPWRIQIDQFVPPVRTIWTP